MQTGFKELDKLICINKPQLILLVDKGSDSSSAELSGDIANNICLKQELPVLEIVTTAKEYLIKRLLINQCGVNYNNWYSKNYTDDELIKIAKSTIDLIESTRRLPTIIEENFLILKQMENFIKEFANETGIYDCERQGLVILDISIFSFYSFKEKIKHLVENKKYTKIFREIRCYLKNIRERKRYIKALRNSVDKYNVPIILTYKLQEKFDDIKLEDVEKFVLKKVDTTILINHKKDDYYINELNIYNKNKLSRCNIKYLPQYRKFIDIEGD